MARLLGPFEDGVRADLKRLIESGAAEIGMDYGEMTIAIATGRSHCRACGHRIAQGERVAHFFWDFTGCGSWTVATCYMHLHQCH